MNRIYPGEGSANAIIDTGYEGFLSVPDSIFVVLGLNKLKGEKRRIALADGSLTNTRGCYSTVRIPHLSMSIDGFIETFAGSNEIVVGVEALLETKVLLDYCIRKVKVEKCH